MIEFHPEIRFVHIAAVIASGSLFLLRGLALFAGAGWAMAMPLRLSSHVIDTVLLTTALMLMTVVRQYPFVDDWLTVKVAFLIVYIVLGSVALRSGATRAVRVGCFIAALLVYGFIVSVARAQDPLGILAGISGS
ncbi:MAG: SirB2 family protein [Dongiaceae bacterium]